MARFALAPLAALFLAGCGVEERLGDEQRRLVPETFELVECEFASGLYGLVSPPASYCVYLARGTKDDVAAVLIASLRAHGYEAEQEPYARAIEVRASGSRYRVQARIGRRDVGPHLVPPAIPLGSVAVSVTVGEPEET